MIVCGRWIFIVGLLCLVNSPQSRASDDAELPGFFAGLRAQGLFSVAEEYALVRLSQPDLIPAQRAILAVELSQVFASHAAEAMSEPEAIELWARAEDTIAPLLMQRDNPRWTAVRSRQATLLSDRALTEFWKSLIAPDSELQRDTAIQAARSALSALQSAASDITASRLPAPRGVAQAADRKSGPPSSRSRLTEGALTTVELRRIGDEIEFHIIRMNLNLARLLPIGPDRAAALIDADKGSVALAKRVNSDFVWPARLARAETMRLRGDPEAAVAYTKSLRVPELWPELTDSLIAEQARAQLALNSPADAIPLILDRGAAQKTLSPELRAIIVECLLATLHSAQVQGDSALTADLWNQATAQQLLITGPWRVYVDALLSRTNETRQYGEQLAALVRAGRAAAQRRDWAASAAAFEQASQQAATNGQTRLAAEFALTRASIEIEAGHLAQAAQWLGEFQTRFPHDVRAPEAHLLAAWVLGKLHEATPSATLRAQYVAQLKEHLTQFSDHPSCVEVQWSLAVDAIQHEEWATAIESLEAIPAEHPRAIAAAVQLPYCYEKVLAETVHEGALHSWEQRAEESLARQRARWPLPPAGWTLAQSQNALRWVQVLLRLQESRYSEAELLLVQILQSRDIEAREMARDGTPIDPAWDKLVPVVTQLRMISLAGLGRIGEAETLFATSKTTSPEDLLAILSGLSDLAGSLDEKSRHDLGRFQLATARRLDTQRSQLSPESTQRVDRCLAEAYTATGDLPEAIALYETLRKTRPRDRSLLETIGKLHLKHAQPEDFQRAKLVYRQLESFDPPGSPAWLRTRLAVARNCLQLGEQAECEKLLKVTRILYPELGGEELQAEYAEIEKRLTNRK